MKLVQSVNKKTTPALKMDANVMNLVLNQKKITCGTNTSDACGNNCATGTYCVPVKSVLTTFVNARLTVPILLRCLAVLIMMLADCCAQPMAQCATRNTFASLENAFVRDLVMHQKKELVDLLIWMDAETIVLTRACCATMDSVAKSPLILVNALNLVLRIALLQLLVVLLMMTFGGNTCEGSYCEAGICIDGACSCAELCQDPSELECGSSVTCPDDNCVVSGTKCDWGYECENSECVCSEPCAEASSVTCGNNYYDGCGILCVGTGTHCDDGYQCEKADANAVMVVQILLPLHVENHTLTGAVNLAEKALVAVNLINVMVLLLLFFFFFLNLIIIIIIITIIFILLNL